MECLDISCRIIDRFWTPVVRGMGVAVILMSAMRAEAAGQTSVSENCGLTSALQPIAAVLVVGFRQAARDPQSGHRHHDRRFRIASSNNLNLTLLQRFASPGSSSNGHTVLSTSRIQW